MASGITLFEVFTLVKECYIQMTAIIERCMSEGGLTKTANVCDIGGVLLVDTATHFAMSARTPQQDQNMKVATYTGLDGAKLVIEYDEDAPCRICGLPVVEASIGGTDVCPWCDCGKHRDGTSWTFRESLQFGAAHE